MSNRTPEPKKIINFAVPAHIAALLNKIAAAEQLNTGKYMSRTAIVSKALTEYARRKHQVLLPKE